MRRTPSARIAVIGAGVAGACTALFLAEAGARVVLFERNPEVWTGASAACEGKIHLGYTYAMDTSFRTARTMLEGAASFRRLLEPRVGSEVFERHASRPFLYAVPRSTMLDAGAIRAYFQRVSSEIAQLGDGLCAARGQPARELPAPEVSATFGGSALVTAFQTEEIAIDPLALRAAVIGAIAGLPRIEVRTGCEVLAIEEAGRRYALRIGEARPAAHAGFDAVVNASWDQRLALDATLGLAASRTAIHRYKCGLRASLPGIGEPLPTATFMLGEYGDTVVYGNVGYVSWYPAGLIAQEVGLKPASSGITLDAKRRRQVIDATLRGLRSLMPGAERVLRPGLACWEVVGGYITAWGRTGIDDRDSELHSRHAIGVHSVRGYHSIDTGKFVMGPLLAAEAAGRILGRRPSS